MTAPDEIEDPFAERLNLARRIAFLVCSSERDLGLPWRDRAPLPMTERCERVLRAAQRGGLDARRYSFVWSLCRAFRQMRLRRSERC
jgi:hypothetical protein